VTGPIGSRSCAPATLSVMLGRGRSHFTFDLGGRLITQLLGIGAIPPAHSSGRTPRGTGAVTERSINPAMEVCLVENCRRYPALLGRNR
jgi:hypothetical protein